MADDSHVTIGGKNVTVKRAAIDAGTGDTTIAAAVTGYKIRLHAISLSFNVGSGTARLESGTGGTALTGLIVTTAGGLFTLPFCEQGWVETASGALLNLEMATATADGLLLYSEVPA